MPHDQEALITRIAAHNPRVIVVLETGGPVLMPRRESVPAILHAFYAGAVGGEAIAALLFGHVSPSGRLPFTIPLSEEDLPCPARIDPQSVVSNPVQLVDRPVVYRDYRI
ncbi:glycoside hydrolase family 3 protein [Asaia krungthepensis]|uniref:Glycoside hydrolase family 3 C-terminal domain-containing protein n=1 Tax=Asaia krungthepensis NRIC 0535 TaxID=1307925 RepID=A0ABQ0PZ28_9PROT|nr:glycoside hydrolase family 3 C-terminal domain-containing protein [Asaia krungthepensis]GBQ85137.1 hypothetical protein AA0535_0682 [Asaia krungthepensis NRIC 0535]